MASFNIVHEASSTLTNQVVEYGVVLQRAQSPQTFGFPISRLVVSFEFVSVVFNYHWEQINI